MHEIENDIRSVKHCLEKEKLETTYESINRRIDK